METSFETDIFSTSAGELSITFLGHASLLIAFNGKNVFIDPFGKVADYSSLPKADIILSTHEHFDHLDPQALAAIRTPETILILNPAGASQVANAIPMRNGDKKTVSGLSYRSRSSLQPAPQARRWTTLPPERHREWLYPDAWRFAPVFGRGHGEHPGNEGIEGY